MANLNLPKYPKTKKVFLVALLAFLVLGGQACSKKETAKLGKPEQVVLEYWSVYNQQSDLQNVIKAYEAINPHIKINVKTLRLDEYEDTLINALAEDRGPDIFSVHNTDIVKFKNKLAPMPATTTIDQAVEKGAVKKQIFTEPKTTPSFSRKYLQETFVDQVLKDIEIDGEIYGLPLSMDTLALYYNKALLNAAGIAEPAKNWQEFQEQVITLTKQDRLGNILQSGAALGLSENVARFSDILSLIMMQNGTQMTDDFGFATFDRLPKGLVRETLPAADAIIFYTDFASPTKQVYTWNSQMPNSLEAFMQGKVAYFFGYNYHQDIIKAQAPKLNFGITKMPQIQGNPEINFANYWIEGVSQKSKHLDEAWNFLQFVSKPENVKLFLDSAKRPTATRSLIKEQLEDEDIGVFAEQLLTAQSWYRGKDAQAMERIFADMIDQVLNGSQEVRKILNAGAVKINQTIR